MSSGPEHRLEEGQLAAEISSKMVRILLGYTGRGPTKARTTVGRDHVLVMLADSLTKGERSLVDAGFSDHVLETRRRYQMAMRVDAISMIEDLTGRSVIGFMSDNHINPDLGAEIFVLSHDGRREQLHEADSHD